MHQRLATPALTLRASVLRFIHLCPPWRQLAPVLLDKVRKNDGGVARAPPRSPGAETPQPDPMTKHALSMERLMGALRDSIVREFVHTLHPTRTVGLPWLGPLNAQWAWDL